VGATESIVDLDGVVMQAWKSDGIAATRRQVEARLIEERQARLNRHRLAGRKAYAWGYLRRKTLLTPVGDLGPIRIPRLRVEGREERLIPRYRRRIGPLDLLTAEATIGGMSQRRMSGWLFRANGERLSAATVGRIVLELGEKLEARRFTRLTPGEYPAVAVDGIYGRYRCAGEAVLVVAIGVRWDGTFDVLDWQAGRSESSALLEGLLDRLYRRGLTSLKLLVGDGAGAGGACQWTNSGVSCGTTGRCTTGWIAARCVQGRGASCAAGGRSRRGRSRRFALISSRRWAICNFLNDGAIGSAPSIWPRDFSATSDASSIGFPDSRTRPIYREAWACTCSARGRSVGLPRE